MFIYVYPLKYPLNYTWIVLGLHRIYNEHVHEDYMWNTHEIHFKYTWITHCAPASSIACVIHCMCKSLIKQNCMCVQLCKCAFVQVLMMMKLIKCFQDNQWFLCYCYQLSLQQRLDGIFLKSLRLPPSQLKPGYDQDETGISSWCMEWFSFLESSPYFGTR